MNENDHRSLPDPEEGQQTIQNKDAQTEDQSPQEEISDNESFIELCLLSILISLELISIFTVVSGHFIIVA